MNGSVHSIRNFLLDLRLYQVIGLAAACLAVSHLNPGFAVEPAGKMRVIIDADTANEIDDLFAIARALVAPEFELEGLTSSLWRHTGSPNSVELSQRLNEKLLDLAGLRDAIPHPQGAAEPMKDKQTPQDSPAARHIIARAHAGSPSNKLLVLILGAPTNPASALLLDPTIADKVTFAFIDGDFREGKWGPGIYNWKNDIHAVQAIFESPVEYFHMPAPTVSGDLVMTRQEAKRHLTGRGPLWDFLIEYWEAHPYYKKHSDNRMWDVALVQAFLRPPLAERQITGAPIIHDVSRVEQFPDNPRQVTVFTRIDVPGMLADFWKAAQSHSDSVP
jgi:purine nucleosidase